MPKRIDPEDTIDTAHHFLYRLAAEGWGVQSVKCDIDYEKPGRKARRLPVEATVVVKLRPTHP